MQPKPTFLDKKDQEEVLALVESPKEEDTIKKKIRTRKLVAMLEHLEEKYEVINFGVKDLGPNGRNYRYLCPEELHSGKAYSQILLQLIQVAEGDDKSRYEEAIQLFYTKQISLFEKLNRCPSKSLLRIFYLELADIYLIIQKPVDYVKVFNKHLNYVKEGDYGSDDIALEKAMEVVEKQSSFLVKSIKQRCNKIKNAGISIFGNNPDMLKSYCDAIIYAQDTEPCLIVGETGTGKEIIASLIHDFSNRSKNNFNVVNVAGYQEHTFEAEVFGVIGGTHTGVTDTRLGIFLRSCGMITDNNQGYGYYIDGKKIAFKPLNSNSDNDQYESVAGTVFLDEINSISFACQSKLLRAIENKEVQLLGDTTVRKFDAKIICAANTEGLKYGSEWSGRMDLFYRFKQVIHLPPLRMMRDSIPEIAKMEMKTLSQKILNNEGIHIHFSKSAMDKLSNYSWPGNFRELRNILYKAIKRIEIEGRMRIEYNDIDIVVNSYESESIYKKCFDGLKWHDLKILYADYLLEKHNGNKTKAGIDAGYGGKQFIDSALKLKNDLKKSK